MSIFVEPSVSCNECGEIEYANGILCIDDLAFFSEWIKDDLPECFADWKITSTKQLCPKCK